MKNKLEALVAYKNIVKNPKKWYEFLGSKYIQIDDFKKVSFELESNSEIEVKPLNSNIINVYLEVQEKQIAYIKVEK